MTQEIYYKATRANGVSGRDPLFIYHIGINIHPNPDRKNTAACGIGIHLAKTIDIAKKYVPGWKEIYEAKAGVILGEDKEKVRCASCQLTRLISSPKIKFPKRPCLCEEWFNKHYLDITSEDIAKQTLEIHSGGQKMTITTKMKKRDRQHLIKSVVR